MLSESVLALREAKLGPYHPDTMRSLNQLAAAYPDAGRAEQAIPLHRRDLAFSAARLGRDHPDTLIAMNNLAAACQATGRAWMRPCRSLRMHWDAARHASDRITPTP